jgi:hypothetical protein
MVKHTFVDIKTSPESESIPLTALYVYPGNGKPAVNVHKHLLDGHAYKTGKIWTAESEQGYQTSLIGTSEGNNSARIKPLVTGLKHHRSLVLYARWLYGRPMWDPVDCTNPKGDLACLTDIYELCAGDRNGEGRDYERTNACLDAIREMLVCDFSPSKPLHNPLSTLLKSLPEASRGRSMVIDLLAFGVCYTKGWTETWQDSWFNNLKVFEVAERGFLFSLSSGLARAGKTGGEKPDPMARCAYHEHPSVVDRLRCEQGL